MSHPTLEDLLDNEDSHWPDASLLSHVNGCERCTGELEALRRRRARLMGLPALSAPAASWSRLEMERARQAKRRWALRSTLVALAASVAVFALWSVWAVRKEPVRPVPGAQSPSIAGLIQRSQALEEELKALPEPSVVEVGDADAQAEMEDGICWVDRYLQELDAQATPDERAALWRTRINLLQSLLELRRPPAVLVSL
jgi:hypothetical protein